MSYPLLFAAKRRAGLTRGESQRLSWAPSLTRRRAAVRMFRLAAADCGKNSNVWAFANAELSRCLPHCPDGPETLCGAIPKRRLLALAAVAVMQQFGRRHSGTACRIFKTT